MYSFILEQLGLPKNEAKIYEALLHGGSSSVTEIANRSQVNRRNVYDSLKNLEERRLCIRVYGEHESLYRAEHPRVLTQLLESQRSQVESVLPDLSELYIDHIPTEQISISRGIEGVKNYCNYVMTHSDTTIYFMAGKGLWHGPQTQAIYKKMSDYCKLNNITIRGIFDYEVSQTGHEIYNRYDLDQIRFLPPQYSSPAVYDICDNRIDFLSFQTQGANMAANSLTVSKPIFSIISAPLVKSHIVWFETMWNFALTLDQTRGSHLVGAAPIPPPLRGRLGGGTLN